MKVWELTWIKLATPGSAVGLTTDCTTGPGRGIFVITHYKLGPVILEQMGFFILFSFTLSAGGHFGQWIGTIFAILKEGIMGNISVN